MLREERERAGFFAAISAGFVAFWRALLGRSSGPAASAGRRTRGAAARGRPSVRTLTSRR